MNKIKGIFIMNHEQLKAQIKKTIAVLEEKYNISSESIILDYLADYRKVLTGLDKPLYMEEALTLSSVLLDKTRGYMEASSNYNQQFLNEMAKTEKIIKNLN